MLVSQPIRRSFGAIVGFVCVGVNAPTLAQNCPGGNLVVDPPPFVWTYHPASPQNPEPYYSGTMEIGEATFDIGGETLTTRAYRQAGGSYTSEQGGRPSAGEASTPSTATRRLSWPSPSTWPRTGCTATS